MSAGPEGPVLASPCQQKTRKCRGANGAFDDLSVIVTEDSAIEGLMIDGHDVEALIAETKAKQQQA